MMDEVIASGNSIDVEKLSKALRNPQLCQFPQVKMRELKMIHDSEKTG